MCQYGVSPVNDQLAEIIWRSVGPSGRNKVTYLRGGVLRVLTRRTQDYLYDLAKAVHKLSPESHDSHLYALEVRHEWSHRLCAAHHHLDQSTVIVI